MPDDFYGKRTLTIHFKLLYAMPRMRGGVEWMAAHLNWNPRPAQLFEWGAKWVSQRQ